jgi:dTDP-4-amino-4,6-dideoxygalactose transaminase
MTDSGHSTPTAARLNSIGAAYPPRALRIGRPRLPELSSLLDGLAGVWQREWVSNCGPLHEELEALLSVRLGAPNLALTASGSSALYLACRALDLSGEVITTPFTFRATVNALRVAGLTPVFCDIEPDRLTLDPDKIAACMTSRTSGILPVHLFGGMAFVDEIAMVACRHGLRVLYDAAHAFDVRCNGRPVAAFGDAAAFSFHATKVFHTIEGGAVAADTAAMRNRIRSLRNHGIEGNECSPESGINAKLNELQALVGLRMLDGVSDDIAQRERIDRWYREYLYGIAGLRPLARQVGVKQNFGFFPIAVEADR